MRAASFATTVVAVFLSAALVVGGTPHVKAAWADEVSDAQAALDEAEARMQSIAEEYDALKAELDELQKRIDETAAQALEAQDAVLEGREALGKSAQFEYRGGSASLLLTLVLESTDFDDLVRNVSYLNAIMQYQSDEIVAQKERTERFNALVSTLNVQKSDQEAKLQELEKKRAEAEQVVSTAQAQLDNVRAEEAARLAALEKAAQDLAAQEQAGGGSINENANTVDREEVVPDGSAVQPNPDPEPPDSGGSGGGSDADSSVGWSTGIASAYGGSTDQYTPNPGITATGDVCDDWSMGVAVPMAWPNYRSYFGRTVEISYNGMTVFATVNDCGNMGGGSRALDLQPGVWKAFGFSSCNAWGLRTVSYRFL